MLLNYEVNMCMLLINLPLHQVLFTITLWGCDHIHTCVTASNDGPGFI